MGVKWRLLPVDMRRIASADIKECSCCKRSKIGYKAIQPEDQPQKLQNLTPAIVEALRPLVADPGTYERAPQGYRVHTAMTRILWSATVVKEKIKALATHAER